MMDQPQAVPLPSVQQYRPIAHIQAVVAMSYQIDVKHMRSDCRCRSVAWPRQVAMYLAREITGKSFPCIGREFGHRDHSTVIKGIGSLERRMSKSALYRADVAVLREALR